MRLASRRIVLGACSVALVGLSAVAAAAEEPRVLVAIDASRSLSAAESAAAVATARDLVVRLPAAARPGVLAFDDEVHWLARPGAAGLEQALEALRPAGRFTVLHDGMVEAIRALDEGGVLVVISDGRDENSATTLEDVARLASGQGVRILTLGAGRVDERTLRRLALLTDGLHAGMASGADPDAVAAQVEALRREVAAARPQVAAPPPAPTPAVAATPAPAAVATPTPSTGLQTLLLVGGLLAAAGIVLGFLLARRRSQPRREAEEPPERGTQPGVAMPEPPPSAPSPAPVDEIQAARLRGRQQVPPGGLVEVSLDDTAAFQRLPFSESIERTLVLTEEVVLSVREPGREPRFFRLPPDRAIDIGRDSKRNTLAFQDPTMSVQHLRLALEEGEVFLLDLDSTNGVVYRERRVDAARLLPGDRFRAGMIEFELLVHHASMT